ncbi:MAG: hypothetical protein ACXAB2_12970, partial [Candidatus Hodarchaeales archaeon]
MNDLLKINKHVIILLLIAFSCFGAPLTSVHSRSRVYSYSEVANTNEFTNFTTILVNTTYHAIFEELNL